MPQGVIGEVGRNASAITTALHCLPARSPSRRKEWYVEEQAVHPILDLAAWRAK